MPTGVYAFLHASLPLALAQGWAPAPPLTTTGVWVGVIWVHLLPSLKTTSHKRTMLLQLWFQGLGFAQVSVSRCFTLERIPVTISIKSKTASSMFFSIKCSVPDLQGGQMPPPPSPLSDSACPCLCHLFPTRPESVKGRNSVPSSLQQR